MAPRKKHRLAPAKIPLELNEQFEAMKESLGLTHTQAVEHCIEKAVKAWQRSQKKR